MDQPIIAALKDIKEDVDINKEIFPLHKFRYYKAKRFQEFI
jgi:hypothetical protein